MGSFAVIMFRVLGIALILSVPVYGQMLNNQSLTAFQGKPEFTIDFIRNKRIQSVYCHVSTKANLDIIRETDERSYYKFNRFGELTFEYKTIPGDTLYTLYVYDERSNLLIRRTADSYGFQSSHYRYDSKNRLIAFESRWQQNSGQDKETHIPAEEYLVTSETYEYVDFGNGDYKKVYRNQSGIVFKEEFYYHDEKGRLITLEGHQSVGAGRSKQTFEYDDKGRIIRKKSESSIMGNYVSSFEYEYDETGNIYSMKYYEQDVYTTEYQYVYDSDSGLLKAFIARDVKSNLMTIVKYDPYSFFSY